MSERHSPRSMRTGCAPTEPYDPAGIHALPHRRAPPHPARHGALALRVPLGGRRSAPAPALRPAGLRAPALPSAAADGRNVMLDQLEQRPPRGWGSAAAYRRSRSSISASTPAKSQTMYLGGLPGAPARRLRYSSATLSFEGEHYRFKDVPMQLWGRCSGRIRLIWYGTAPIRKARSRRRPPTSTSSAPRRAPKTLRVNHRPLPCALVEKEGQRPGATAVHRHQPARGDWRAPMPRR